MTYEGGSELPASITLTEEIQNGTILKTTIVEFVWGVDGNARLERTRILHDDVPTGQEHWWTWTYEDGSLLVIEERRSYPEVDGGGDYTDARFTDDDGIERSLLRQEWNTQGQLQNAVLFAGAEEAVIEETLYSWNNDGTLGAVTITRDTGDSNATQAGCDAPEPGVVVCETILEYRDGELAAYIEAGQRYAVSDSCCGVCVSE